MSGSVRVDAMIAWRVVVRGRVQGVGYRISMREAADDLRVTGWVRNRRDGTVEAVVQGDDDHVERMVAWCRRGPPAARVTTVTTEALSVDPAMGSFELRRTE
jgi:acylphosphatase